MYQVPLEPISWDTSEEKFKQYWFVLAPTSYLVNASFSDHPSQESTPFRKIEVLSP